MAYSIGVVSFVTDDRLKYGHLSGICPSWPGLLATILPYHGIRPEPFLAFHIPHSAASKFRANRVASNNGDANTLLRNLVRRSASPDISLASVTALDMYSSLFEATHSPKPAAISMLAPCLDTMRSPARVNVGTPIHKPSQVVVPPGKGKVSRIRSTSACAA